MVYPQQQSVLVGSAVLINCKSYKISVWHRDNQIILNDDTIITTVTYLVLLSVGFSNRGNYSCYGFIKSKYCYIGSSILEVEPQGKLCKLILYAKFSVLLLIATTVSPFAEYHVFNYRIRLTRTTTLS